MLDLSKEMVVPLTVQNGQQQNFKNTQNSNSVIQKNTYDTSTSQSKQQADQSIPKQIIKKDIRIKAPEPQVIVQDSLWNIYSGNPGLFSTEGDTIAFGNVTSLSDSLFLENQRTLTESGKPYGMEGKLIDFPKQDWLLGILLIAWILFATVRVGFTKYLELLVTSLVNISTAAKLYRERGYKIFYGAMRLNFIFYLILPLSVFQIFDFFHLAIPGLSGLLLFLILLVSVSGYFILKYLLYQVIGSIIMLKEEVHESSFNMYLYYKVMALVLLPIVTIHAMGHQAAFITVWIMIILIPLFYFASVVRSIYIGNLKGISIFYSILYLCILEILPLILLFKILTTE